MVDDEIDRNQRVDLFRVAAEVLQAVAHSCQIDNGRNAGEVLHEYACRAIGDFRACRAAIIQPLGNGFDVRLLDRAVIFEAEQVLEQNLHGERELGDAFEAVFFGFGQAVINIFLTGDGKGFAAFKAVNV
ncbi:hypothetical protein D9M72_544900 [compost metagenome]